MDFEDQEILRLLDDAPYRLGRVASRISNRLGACKSERLARKISQELFNLVEQIKADCARRDMGR